MEDILHISMGEGRFIEEGHSYQDTEKEVWWRKRIVNC